MLSKGIGLLTIILTISIGLVPVFALTELERASISDPRLVDSFGSPIGNNVNINQQIQISADITNHQDKSQNFNYLVQVKDENDFVVKLVWFSGELNPHQEWNTSVFWFPQKAGEYTAEIFVWEGFPVNHRALTEYTTLPIKVS